MKKIRLQLYANMMFFIAGIFLCSCSDDGPGYILPKPVYEHPVSFITQIENRATGRSTTVNAWTGDEQVAVRFGDSGAIKQYRISAAGELTSDAPFYWEDTGPAIVTAWYPYSAVQPVDFTVQTDQSGTGYEESDMLMACREVTRENPTLSFSHLPVKITINIKGDENAGDISGAVVSIVNVSVTSGAVLADASGKITVEKSVLPGDMTIIPQEAVQATPGYQKTLLALMVPQKKDNSQFIRISLNGKDSYYTPSAGEADITAGNHYTYNITVKGTVKNIEARSYRYEIRHE